MKKQLIEELHLKNMTSLIDKNDILSILKNIKYLLQEDTDHPDFINALVKESLIIVVNNNSNNVNILSQILQFCEDKNLSILPIKNIIYENIKNIFETVCENYYLPHRQPQVFNNLLNVVQYLTKNDMLINKELITQISSIFDYEEQWEDIDKQKYFELIKLYEEKSSKHKNLNDGSILSVRKITI